MANAPSKWLARLDELYIPQPGVKIKTLSPEWWQARRGRLTASSRASVIGNFKEKSLLTLIGKLNAELADGWEPSEGFRNEAMDRGNDIEAQAIADIELTYAQDADEPGCILHPTRRYCSATPDFFLGDDVTGQIKSPLKSDIHLGFVHNREIPSNYRWQVQWESWCAQRKRILFVSFDPRQPMATRSAHIWLDADMETWALFDANSERFKTYYETGKLPGVAKFAGHTVGNTLPQIF